MELLMDRKGSRILRIVTCVGKRVRLKNVQNASQQTCDQTCQKYHWFVHKKYCQKLKLEMEK